VFLENAGGSQVPQSVIDRMVAFMREEFVQTGAGYETSANASRTYARAHTLLNRWMNGSEVGQTVIGPSSSILLHLLGQAYAKVLEPGDEVVVSQANHEANVGPWVKLKDQGVVVKFWSVDHVSGLSSIGELSTVLNERTRLVAVPHASNLLGDTMPLKEICEEAHAVGAKVVADGVAYAPHRAIDVEESGVDFYVFSLYKTFGPHLAAMFGRSDAWAKLPSVNHFFIGDDAVPGKFELGCQSYEAAAGVLGIGDYFLSIIEEDPEEDDLPSRAQIERAFESIAELEHPLTEQMLEELKRKNVRLYGSPEADDQRHPTVSFSKPGSLSAGIAKEANAAGIGIRSGHMYAHRLCEAVGLKPDDGVVRISALHYNSPEEIERAFDVLNQVL
jgi:cysteine desulfurase family protein (TIGR01976 family)